MKISKGFSKQTPRGISGENMEINLKGLLEKKTICRNASKDVWKRTSRNFFKIPGKMYKENAGAVSERNLRRFSDRIPGWISANPLHSVVHSCFQ